MLKRIVMHRNARLILALAASLGSTSLGILGASPAAAADGPYAGLLIGPNFAASDAVSHPQLASVSRKTGVAAALVAGWKYGFLRGELEGGWRSAGIDEVRFKVLASGFKTAGSRLEGLYGMANLYADWSLGPSFTPFLGAGVGVQEARLNRAVRIEGLNLDLLKGGETKFAWQAVAGIAWHPAPAWSVSLDYRYVGTSDVQLDYARALSTAAARIENRTHQVTFGIRRTF